MRTSPLRSRVGIRPICGTAALALAVLGASAPWVRAAEAPAPSPEEFRLRYPAALAKLEEFYSQVYGTGTHTFKAIVLGQERVNDKEFALDGSAVRLVSTVTVNTYTKNQTVGKVSAGVIHPGGAFRLHRDPGRKDYAIDWMGNDSVAERYGNLRRLLRDDLQLLGAPCRLASISLSALLAHPTFTLKRVTADDAKDIPVWRVEFESDFSQTKSELVDGRIGRFAGWFTVAPDQAWAVRAYEVVSVFPKATTTTKGTVEYDGDLDGFPRLKRAEALSLPNGQLQASDTLVISELHHGVLPPEKYTLESFGVSTPPSIKRRPSMWFWMLLVATLALVGAVTFRLLARRQRAAA